MKTNRLALLTTLLLLPLIVTCTILTRFHDGPIGQLPGGRLISGQVADFTTVDLGLLRNLSEIELQLEEPSSSRITWVVVDNEDVYVPSGFMNWQVWIRWPYLAQRDGRAIVRISGRRYFVQLDRVTDTLLLTRLLRHRERKYNLSRQASNFDRIWFFRLSPRF